VALADHVLIENLADLAGLGQLVPADASPEVSWTSSRMMSLHRSTHSSQMNTDGPAISLRTSCWLLPQKEQYSSLLLSPPLSFVITTPPE
jgi:hypothetical protein